MQSTLDRTRAGIAAELARHYSELSQPEAEHRFSPCRAILNQFEGGPSPQRGRYESDVLAAHAALQGENARMGMRTWPWNCFTTRALATQPGAKGGYLSGVDVAPGAQALRPWSVALQAGVQVLESVSSATIVVPRVATAPAGAWLAEGAAASDASTLALGSVSLSQKTYIVVTTISEQLLRQGGPSVDAFISTMLLRAAGRALDAAILAGAGGAEPLGLLNAGLTTQSGTSLTWATTLATFKTLHNAGVDPARISVVLAPAAAETLGQREKISTAGRFILDVGRINEAPAYTAPDMGSAANALVGDFSNVALALFGGGLRVDTSTASGFNTGTVAVRVMVEADTAVLQSGALVKISAIT